MVVARENLGPAETILQTLLTHNDHMVHNRIGMVVPNAATRIGAEWFPVAIKTEGDVRVVYRKTKIGKREVETRMGELREDNSVFNGRKVGEFREAGLYPEVAVWMYSQIAAVWKMDNEFAARWASYAFPGEHRDLKVALAAFMLVQSRSGAPVVQDGQVLFHDDDYRDVGEAMMLFYQKGAKHQFDPKYLLRIYDLLKLPQIAKINRDLGFGRSQRNPCLGRWPKAVEKYLRYREENPQLLESAVKAGWKGSLMKLARIVKYKPESAKFFEILGWKQHQAPDGRRTIAIGQDIKGAATWNGLTEAQICERITTEKPNWKRLMGSLPKEVGLTRAIMAAAIEAQTISDKELIILTPTLEELGLMQVQDIRERWQRAVKAAEDVRAANIARNVKSKDTKEALQEAADTAVQKAVEEVMRDMRVYFMVDISSSMSGAIAKAKEYIAKFLQAFPLDRLHVSVFNTAGRELQIKHASAAGIEQAFRGITANGGTDYGAGVRALQAHKPKESEDTLFIFVGDEGHNSGTNFLTAVQTSGLRPQAFGLLKLPGDNGNAVHNTAAQLGIPCFRIEEGTFADPYAIPRVVKNLIAATPVGVVNVARVAPRVSLVDTILATELLKKPAWAA